MNIRLDEKTIKRIYQLKYEQELTDKVISIRLGISERTVRVYTRANREGSVPYKPDEKADVSPTSDDDIINK